MPLTPVESSNIKAVDYEPDSRALTVEFHSGAQHRYEDVSAEKHAEFMKSDSKGSYFHANIRGAHQSSRIDEPTD